MTTIIVGVILYLIVGIASATLILFVEGDESADANTHIFAFVATIFWPCVLLCFLPVWFTRLIRERATRKPTPWTSELD